MKHLARTRSDHTPQLLSCGGHNLHFRTLLRFLMFWVGKDDFKDVVKQICVFEELDDILIYLK